MAIQRSVVLTKRVIEETQAEARAQSVELWRWDSKVRGLGIRVKPNGHTSYLLRYRNREGRSRKLTIGSTTIFGVEQARIRQRYPPDHQREGAAIVPIAAVEIAEGAL
jgi:hypothetical protein